ncbi:MAG: F0F1 ATP synthase subunit A [Micavibrio aeruginosavorus]|uniref:ATP synthase subunit a n=1 Tax=Micavibrio aeruginosavorus TaxID=349221 RepID=A0A2W5FI75_9BACT|nr:MAG: F0F1 ATP synthase subunit A [Micavibrio aeruginosavorus]
MASPMHQFEIAPLVPFTAGSLDLSFTNSSLWMMITVFVSVIFFSIATAPKAIIPGRMQVMAEGAYNFVANLITDNMGGPDGKRGKEYFPLIFTLFMFVFLGNALGLIPYSFTYTSHLAVTAGLALLVFFAVLIIGVIRHGFHFFSLFAPSGVPGWLMPLVVMIEFVSFLSRPITLSVRLFANMVAGHVLLKVIAGFCIMFATIGGAAWLGVILPVAMNVVMLGFELFIAFIQAYVFAVLTCIYLKDTIEIEH